MAGPEPVDRSPRSRHEGHARVALLLLATTAWLGCSSSPGADPEALPPQTSTRHRAESPTPTPVPAPPPTVTPAPTTIVIEPPRAESEGEVSLVEAARREKERRAGAAPPAVKLDNKNLGTFAANQKLTVASPENVTAEADASSTETTEPQSQAAGSGSDESYWREGARAIRERWADAVDDVARLEAESADLRRQFYAEDDPYVRDQQVKPEWDRVLGELDRARRDAAQAPRDLEAFLDEGRRAGALPGWLREGIELEPEESPEAGAPTDPAEPREPVVVERDPENP